MNHITDTLRNIDHDITLDERHQAADRIQDALAARGGRCVPCVLRDRTSAHHQTTKDHT